MLQIRASVFQEKEVIVMAKHTCKQTSKSVASKASSILRDGKTSAKTKSVAASALAQTKSTKKK